MRSVFTLATGNGVYLEYAFTLAMSFLLHHKNSSLRFFLVTDMSFEKPQYLEKIEVILIEKESIAKGISSKLYLDKIAPSEKSLFIDSDCLCFRNLESVFDYFDGHAVSVVGFPILNTEWCGVLAEDICQKFNIKQIPRFNGGIYYIEKGEKATKIYETARSLEPYYDQLGFARHRGWCNEEPLVSVAIAVNNETAIIDDGTILSDLASCFNSAKLDVLLGECILYNPPLPDPKNKWWYKFSEYSPAIIHFSGGAGTTYPYTREKFKLLLTNQFNCPGWMANLLGKALFTLPFKINKFFKDILRPTYIYLFGYRKIQVSNRPFATNEETN